MECILDNCCSAYKGYECGNKCAALKILICCNKNKKDGALFPCSDLTKALIDKNFVIHIGHGSIELEETLWLKITNQGLDLLNSSIDEKKNKLGLISNKR